MNHDSFFQEEKKEYLVIQNNIYNTQMKKYIGLGFAILTLVACKTNVKESSSFSTENVNMEDYQVFGEKVVSGKVFKPSVMAHQYQYLNKGDTLDVAFSGKVNSVCQVKGCWIKVDLGSSEEAMVKFKDYGFFMPKDIAKDSVIVQGKAFIKETSVEELKHLASDAGKTQEEIDAIRDPKRVLSFLAKGVLLKK